MVVTYWGFRLMMTAGLLMMALSAYFLWALRGKIERARWLKWAPWVIVLPYVANASGWILAEMGRQPWIVQGLLNRKPGRFTEPDDRRPAHQPDRLCRFCTAAWQAPTCISCGSMPSRGRRRPWWSPLRWQPFASARKTRREVRMSHEIASNHLVHPDRGPVDRLLFPRGIRFRRRYAAAVPGQEGRRTPCHHQHHRALLGRQ